MMAGREKEIDEVLNEDASASVEVPMTPPEASRPKPAAKSRKSTAKPKPTPEPDPPEPEMVEEKPIGAPPTPPTRKRSAWPLILGLVLLGAAGYAGWQAPKWLGQTDQVAALTTSLTEVSAENDQLQATIADLQSRLAALEERPVGAGEDQIAALGLAVEGAGPRLDQIETTVGRLGERLTALERAASTAGDGTVSDTALAGLQSQLDQLKAETDERFAALAADLEAQAAAIPEVTDMTARDTTAEIGAALQTGASFATPLMILSEQSGPSEAVEILARHSNGVATLSDLQSSFPDVAREALAVARTNSTEAETGGFTGFVKGQLGMRSLTPQDGSDADAVLSRAEAKLNVGDLGAALDELTALPDAVRAPMADWLARAEARQEAIAAYATLTNSGG